MKLNFKLLRIIVLALLLFVLVSQTDILPKVFGQKTAQAVGDLIVDWGVDPAEPLFKIINMAPGEETAKTVKITNNASQTKSLSIRGIKTSETGSLASQLILIITKDGGPIWGPKNLQEFFNDSSAINGIPLTDLGAGITANYDFKVGFDPLAGNDYQGKNVVFDLQIGIVTQIPAECKNIKFDKIIYGTDKNDRLRGGNGNNLIFGFEGDDTISGGNGNDCIVGGPGNDRLAGGNGNDIIFGNEGDDRLEGGNGNDLLDGGPGKDSLFGGNGNDNLIGGGDYDKADGQLGTDACEAELKVGCER